jgi:nucleoside-diphosphate-sugar epimerase
VSGETHPDDTLLVVGTGYVGLRCLSQNPERTSIGLSRSPVSAAQPIHVYDLDAADSLPITLPNRYRVLYTVPPPATSDQDDRLQRLLDALRPAPDCFVYISTTGVYGDCGGALVDEQREPNPTTARARRRVAAERQLLEWSQTPGIRLCTLRAPGIYGPGRLGIERIRAGLPVIRESEAGPGNRIHVDDLVTCCQAAVSSEAASGVFNVGDGDNRSSTWFAQEVARQCGLPLLPEISRKEAARQFSPQRMSFLGESRRIDTRKMREVLGVIPRYGNAADGIRASLAAQDEIEP